MYNDNFQINSCFFQKIIIFGVQLKVALNISTK